MSNSQYPISNIQVTNHTSRATCVVRHLDIGYWILAIGHLPCLFLLALPSCAAAPTTQPAYGPGKTIATLDLAALKESSGLACSRRTPGVFWSHNDSGDKPRVYAFDRKGRHLATVTVTGAKARDWEDMASATIDGKPYLLLADVGDNNAKRKHVTLYVVEEPALRDGATGAELEAPVARKIDVQYPDGPADCESVAIDPTEKRIYLLTKRRTPPLLYAVPWDADSTKAPVLAEKIATVAFPQATGMDISPDGRRLVVCGYLNAMEFTRDEKEGWAEALAKNSRRTIGLPLRRQGESICYRPDGKGLYLTSEKAPTPLIEVPPKGTP